MWYTYNRKRRWIIKRILIILAVFTLFTACSNKEENNTGQNDITYTNKYECKRVGSYTKFDIENRNFNTIGLTTEEISEKLEEKKNSPVAVNIEQVKIYDFNKEGSKLLNYVDIEKYEYIIDVNIQKEKEYYEEECAKYSNEWYKSCNVDIKDNTIIITKPYNLNSEQNKDMVKKTTKNNIIEAYSEDDLFTCEG